MRSFVECKHCVLNDNISGVIIDSNGICNICTQTNFLLKQYGTGKLEGKDKLNRIIQKIRSNGTGKKFDCIIGVSGGTDSSYVVHKAVNEWNLRPLLAHYDNTWNTSLASANIFKIVNHLNLTLDSFVLHSRDSEELLRSFLKAGVPELDGATDLGFAYYLRKTAAKYKIKYVLEAHSFIEEGITPLGNNYFDGKYIQDVHRKFGEYKLINYPLMTFSRFISSIIFNNVEIIRPLWYLDYSKKEAREILKNQYDWEYYGGHHLENEITKMLHTVYLPQKFNVDTRLNSIAAQVRAGKMNKAYAHMLLGSPPIEDKNSTNYLLFRLNISENEFSKLIHEPGKNWRDFKNYKKYFRFFKLLFLFWAKQGKVPMSFYLKYCAKK